MKPLDNGYRGPRVHYCVPFTQKENLKRKTGQEKSRGGLAHSRSAPPPWHAEASAQASVKARPRSWLLFTTIAAAIPTTTTIAASAHTATRTVTNIVASAQPTMPTSAHTVSPSQAHPTVPTSTDTNMANLPTPFLRLHLCFL
ncbi:hypothetical protein TSMEX_010878 [Taenia solium]|eukprot:TsM_000889500 transcript=TsM_000889500 gene=TsM_000889500